MSTQELSDQEVLSALVESGRDLIRRINARQAALGEIENDERWSGPLPLRFDAQIQVHLLAAMDACYCALSILERRASQQIFGIIRFQVEGVATLRWLVESSDPRERQRRAYQILLGQQTRLVRFLKRDRDTPPLAISEMATSGPDEEAASTIGDIGGQEESPDDSWDADKAVKAAEEQLARLKQLADEDGYGQLEEGPKRDELFGPYFPEGNHAAFHMYSELGSHPPGTGNVLFAYNPETGRTSFDLEAHWDKRAWWASTAIRQLVKACVAVAQALEWDEWFAQQITSWQDEFMPLLREARMRQASAD